MNRADTTTRKVTTAIVVSVGLFAGGDSYSHIFHLARDHGQDVVSAALVPLAGDGLVVAASATMLQKGPIPRWRRKGNRAFLIAQRCRVPLGADGAGSASTFRLALAPRPRPRPQSPGRLPA